MTVKELINVNMRWYKRTLIDVYVEAEKETMKQATLALRYSEVEVIWFNDDSIRIRG